MARSSFRDRFLTPPVARAIMSPLGIVLFGAAAAGAILIGAPIVAAAGIGAVAWGGRVLAAVPRDPKRGDRIEPFTLSDPWKSYVIGAQQSKERFDRMVHDMAAGPLKERLADLASRLDDGVAESWRIARRGNDISGSAGPARHGECPGRAGGTAGDDRQRDTAAFDGEDDRGARGADRVGPTAAGRRPTTPSRGCGCSTPGSTSSSRAASR